MKNVIRAIVVFMALPPCPGLAAADEPAGVKVEFRRARDDAAPGFSSRRIEGGTDSLFVDDMPGFVLSPGDLAEVKSDKDERQKPAVAITFKAPGREKMGALTGGWVDQRLAILVDGKVISAPTIRTKITDAALISGGLTESEVERIVRGLKAK